MSIESKVPPVPTVNFSLTVEQGVKHDKQPTQKTD